MKALRFVTAILFVLTLVAYVLFSFYNIKNSDNTYPTISLSENEIEVSISASDSDLLKGVTAFDEKDGDITDKIIVESISQFIEDGVCNITYAVADSDCHVAKAVRTVHYTDYTSPRFYLNSPLVFSAGEKADFRKIIGAVDCIDGDISDKIAVVSTDYTSTTVGVYTVSVQVTNSRGDIIYLELPVYVEQNNSFAPTVGLSESMVYIKKGEAPDYGSYVTGVFQNSTLLEGNIPVYSAEVDSNTPGVYSVHYYATNDMGYTGHNVLNVIVEE